MRVEGRGWEQDRMESYVPFAASGGLVCTKKKKKKEGHLILNV